ncbi:hypothetical protein WA171_002008 [Blastocystis sp. BT1]
MNAAIQRLLYMPPKCTYNPNSFGSCSYYEIDEHIPVMYIKSLYSAQYTIVYSHANAEDISQLRHFLRCMSHQVYCDVVSYDYPGYGRNTEPLSEQAVKKTGVRVVEYLVNSLRIEPERIVLFGHSLGSAVSLYTAVYLAEQSNIRVGGVILQSCFTSIYRVVSNFRTTSTHDMFPSCDIIGRICCPVCMIHGKHDVIVPIWHAKWMFMKTPEKYRYKCLFVEGAGHNNIESWCHPEAAYYRFIREFLEYLTKFKLKSELLQESGVL